MVSRKLIAAVKLSHRRAYEIAHEAGLHPSTLSRLLVGIDKVYPGDERILRVGKAVGIPAEECFEEIGAP
jgi:lambda repressor-like predicted transcriptional regulator